MIFPYNYRTIHDAVIGHGGQSGEYKYVDIVKTELYNIKDDIGETTNVAEGCPDIVRKLNMFADSCRIDKGDALTGVKGKNTREPVSRSPLN